MQKTNNRYVYILLILIVGIFIFMGKKDGKSIKIGVFEPLTGDASAFGEVAKNGFSMAIDEINGSGGINGKKVEVVYEDSKCSGKDAVSVVQKMITVDKVDVLVGAMCSSEVLSALPITENKPILFLGQGSSPDITGRGKFFFRTWPSDALSGKAMAEFLADKYKTISIITEKTDYAAALEESFAKESKNLDLTILNQESFVTGIKDFRSNLNKIKQKSPEVLFINTQSGQNAAIIAKQAREMGINAQFLVFFFTGDEFIKSGSAVEGTMILDVPSLNVLNEKAKKYVDSYKKKFGTMNYPFVGAQMYDYAYILRKVIESEGLSVVRQANFLRGMKEYDGVIGKFSFDDSGDVVGIGFNFRKIEGGELVDVK